MLGKKEMKVGTLVYWSAMSIIFAVLICVQPVMAAETMWDRFSAIMRDFYGQIVAVSTIVAVTMAAVALVVRMVSRNQKAVDEATAWLKRIVITWIILNSLGFIVAYIQPLIAGGNFGG
jgi:putative copper export protein